MLIAEHLCFALKSNCMLSRVKAFEAQQRPAEIASKRILNVCICVTGVYMFMALMSLLKSTSVALPRVSIVRFCHKCIMWHELLIMTALFK